MVRYVQRPWYAPLGFMASSPASYAPMMAVIAVLAVFPLRYHISEFFERQRDGPHVELRHKAVKYYAEMERMHRRQAMVNLQSIQDDNAPHRQSTLLTIESMQAGHLEQENNYWYAHERDAMRAEKLMLEIRELKAKMAAQSS